MPTTRFETTIKALKDGAQSFTAEKAVTNIEGWEDYLSKHDHEGVKAVVTDLGKLKKLLQAEPLDGSQDQGRAAQAGQGDDQGCGRRGERREREDEGAGRDAVGRLA